MIAAADLEKSLAECEQNMELIYHRILENERINLRPQKKPSKPALRLVSICTRTNDFEGLG